MVVLCLAAFTHARAAGVTSIEFRASVLDGLGMVVEASATAAPQLPGQLGYAVDDPATLRFVAPGGDFEGFAGGELRHSGELILRTDDRAFVLSDFVLRVAANPLDLELFDTAGRRYLRFEAAQPYVRDGELHVQNIDVTMTREFAAALGHPELTGSYLGRAHLRLPAPSRALEVQPAGAVQCPDVFTADRDVALTSLGSVSQIAREPGGRVSLSLSAVLRNVGTSAVEWYASIEPDSGGGPAIGEHPYLALHLYRLQSGRLKQIGRSDVKHAFYTINVRCPCLGGHVIYPDCEDVYGANTNANRDYLAPREEVSAGTGEWTRFGSHFDDLPVNDFRNHGEGDHDNYEHLLMVQEADLQEPGEFFVEGWYIVRDDVDLFNSMGSYPISPDLGMVWTFGPDAVITQGSILERLIAARAPDAVARAGLLDTGEGRLQLAVVSTDLGGGQYHHEYALMNFDFDRQVGAFEIGLAAGIDATNLEFTDVDRVAGNDWSMTNGGQVLTWTAPAGNEQDWGTLYSFAFDANDPEPEVRATVFAGEAGARASYDVATSVVATGDPEPEPDEGGSSSSSALGPALLVLALAAVVGHRRRRFG